MTALGEASALSMLVSLVLATMDALRSQPESLWFKFVMALDTAVSI